MKRLPPGSPRPRRAGLRRRSSRSRLWLRVGGKLTPQGTAAIAAIEQTACALVPVVSGSQTAGVVCSDVAPLVQAIVSAFASAPAAHGQARLCRLAPIARGSTGLGYVCASYADEVNRQLAGDGGTR